MGVFLRMNVAAPLDVDECGRYRNFHFISESLPILYEVRMKKLLFLLMLLVVMTLQAQTQTGISGDWRAVIMVPDGTPDAVVREFNLELKAQGNSVTGTVTGASIAIR